MHFLIHNSAAPDSHSAKAALKFARATIEEKLKLSVFFSGASLETFLNPNDKLSEEWQELVETSGEKILCCSSASERLLNNKLPGFSEIAGLGQLLDLSDSADRVINFGSR